MDSIALYSSNSSEEDWDAEETVNSEDDFDPASSDEETSPVSKKKSKITDYFLKVPDPSKSSEFPSSLRSFTPTDVHRSRPRGRPVGRPKRVRPRSTSPSNESPTAKKSRCAYKSYSLKRKIEIVNFARQANSEALASAKYDVPRSTIYSWRNIDKEPAAANKKISKRRKGINLKKRGRTTFNLL